MSTSRINPNAGFVDDGTVQRCRRCGAEPKPPKRTFCSEECVHEWKLRTQSAYLRQETYRRDRGVCVGCSVDTCADLKLRVPEWSHIGQIPRRSGHLWQADHIKPVIEGGGECGLDNIRTLCTACHKAATKELAARRAAARKAATL